MYKNHSLKMLKHFERCCLKRLKHLDSEIDHTQDRLCDIMKEVDKREPVLEANNNE